MLECVVLLDTVWKVFPRVRLVFTVGPARHGQDGDPMVSCFLFPVRIIIISQAHFPPVLPFSDMEFARSASIHIQSVPLYGLFKT